MAVRSDPEKVAPVQGQVASTVLSRLVGQRCSAARRGIGAFLFFDFGPAHEDKGCEWCLWVYLGRWVITEDGKVLTQSERTTDEQIDGAIGQAVGRRLVTIDLDDTDGSTTFAFEGNLAVSVSRPTFDEDDDWWTLFTPDGSLSFAAEPRWRYEPDVS